MTIAATIMTYLADKGVPYDIVSHRRSGDSLDSAIAAQVPGDKLAKAIVLKDEEGYLVAVMPALWKIKMSQIHKVTGRPHLQLVTEDQLSPLFKDCEVGAVPAIAPAYGLATIWDASLGSADPVYFEGGDHVSLVRVSGAEFRRLMADAGCGNLGNLGWPA